MKNRAFRTLRRWGCLLAAVLALVTPVLATPPPEDFYVDVRTYLPEGHVTDGSVDYKVQIQKCLDEHVAVLYSLLLERGIRPGHDLITISCNGDHPWLRHLLPQPATVDLHPDQLGRLAVDRLIARIDSPGDGPVCVQVSPSLIPGREVTMQART